MFVEVQSIDSFNLERDVIVSYLIELAAGFFLSFLGLCTVIFDTLCFQPSMLQKGKKAMNWLS